MEAAEDLLRCLLQVIGRGTIPLEEVRRIVATGKSQVKAYNLFDGTRTNRDVSAKTKINEGNLSRAVSRWMQSGVAFRLGEGKEARVLHLYPIPEGKPAREPRSKPKARSRRKRP